MIFENTQEPIIDQETFDIVQRIREGRRKKTFLGIPDMLSGILLHAIRRVTDFARAHEDEFIALIAKKSRKAADKALRDAKREMEQTGKRMRKLDLLIQRFYEDNVNGFLSIVRKYTDIPELTSEIVREFIEKVYIFHPEVADGKRTQKIVIVWNSIGEFNARTLDAENEQA